MINGKLEIRSLRFITNNHVAALLQPAPTC